MSDKPSILGDLSDRRQQAGQAEYPVTITETLERTVYVSAKDAAEAERLVETGWKASEYILDAEHFTGVAFKAQEPERTVGKEKSNTGPEL